MILNAKNLFTTSIIATLILVVWSTEATAEGKRHKYVRESVEVAQHQVFGSDVEVDGATILISDYRNKVVDINVTSKALAPDTAYSIWIAAFNRPQHCAEPYACGLGDLGNPQVKASVFWGGGLISDAFGYGGTHLKVVPGKTKRELFAGGDFGMANMSAELHVVLRSHDIIGGAGRLADQLAIAGLACPPANCTNDFASIHPLTEGSNQRRGQRRLPPSGYRLDR